MVSVTEELGTIDISSENLQKLFERVLTTHPVLIAAGIAFKPLGMAANIRATLAVAKGDGIEQLQLEDVYDCTSARIEWYSAAMEKGATWEEPYLDKALRMMVVAYSAPLPMTGNTVGRQHPAI